MDEQFIVNILAQLDTSKINQQLKELSNGKGITVQINADLKNLRKQIEDGLKGASNSANSRSGGRSGRISGSSSNALTRRIESIQSALNSKVYESTYKKLETTLNRFSSQSGKSYDDAAKAIKSYKDAYTELERTVNDADFNGASTQAESLSKQLKEVENAAKAARNYLSVLNSTGIKQSSSTSNKSNSQLSAIERAQKAMDSNAYDASLAQMQKSLNKYINDNSKEYSNAANSVNDYKTSIDSLRTALNALKTNSGDEGIKDVIEALNDLNSAASLAKNNLSILRANGTIMSTSQPDLSGKVTEAQKGVASKEYDVRLSKMKTELSKFANDSSQAFNSASAAVTTYETNIKNLETAVKALNDNRTLETEKQVADSLDEVNSSARLAQNSMSILSTENSKLADQTRFVSTITSFERWCEKNTKAVKAYGNEIEGIRRSLHAVETEADFSNVRGQITELQQRALASGNTGSTLFSTLRNNLGKFTTWLGAGTIVMQGINTAKQMVNAVYEIDTAMTNLYKVTDETSEKYDQFLTNATAKAQELGRTISSFVEQSANWAKLGFNIDESAQLAQVSSIYANVGEVDDDTAVSDIVTAMKAYGIAADDAMSIIDKYNELGNNFAVSSAGLGEGISNAASSLALANNDINQSLAMLTGMTEITQNASESGNALKILSMRLRGYDEETQEYSNDVEVLSGNIADLTKTAETPGGISIFADETKETFKSTYEIIEDISKIWDELTDKQRADLLEVLAGKQRGNSIAALIQAFQSGQVEAAYTAAAEGSVGSAMEEQERWMGSLQAKLGQLQAAFQGLAQVTIDDSWLKSGVDSATILLNLITQIVDKIGIIPTIIAGTIGGKLIKTISSFNATQSLANLFDKDSVQTVDSINKALEGFSNNARNAAVDVMGIGEQMEAAAKKGAGAAKQTEILGNAMNVAGVKATSFGTSLKNAFFGTPFATITTIISAIGLLTPVFDALITTQEEVEEAAEEAQSAIEDSQNSYKTLADTVDDVGKEYAELKQGVDSMNNNESLSTDSYERFLDINNQLADLMPELVVGYDSNGNAILDLNGDVNTITASLNELLETERQLAHQTILDNAGDVFAGAAQKIQSYYDAYQRAQSQQDSFLSNQNPNFLDRFQSTGNYYGGYNIAFNTGMQGLNTDEVKQIKAELEEAARSFGVELEDIVTAYADDGSAILKFTLDGTDWKTFQQEASGIGDLFSESMNAGVATTQKAMHDAAESMDAEWKTLLTIVTEYFEDDSNWTALSDAEQKAVNGILQSISLMDNQWLLEDVLAEDPAKTFEDIKNYIFSIFETDQLSDDQKIAIADLFTTDYSELPHDEYIAQAEEKLDVARKYFADNDIPVSLDFVIEDAKATYDAFINRTNELMGGNSTLAEEFRKELDWRGIDTQAEIDYFMSVTEGAEHGWQALQMYDEAVQQAQNSTENLQSILDSAGDSFGNLNTALSESASATGLSSESIAALESMFKDIEGYDPERLFERTANGIRLNADEFRALSAAYDQSNIDVYYEAVTDAYNNWQNAIANGADQEEIDRLKGIYDNATLLASQYSGLTSAYQAYLDAQSSSNAGEIYTGIQGAIEQAEDLWNQGLVGTDDFRSIADLFSSKDLRFADTDEVVEAYQNALPVIEKYFTESRRGVERFLDDFGKFNEETQEWDFDFNTQEIADQLGIDVEAVQAIFRRMEDYGLSVHIDDTDLIALPERIYRAQDALKELQEAGKATDIEFDFDTENLDSIESQLEDAKSILDGLRGEDGTLNMDSSEVQNAIYLVEFLLNRKHELANSTLMSIDTTEADRDIANAIELLREYQEALDNLETANVTGTSEEQVLAVAEMANKLVEIQNLPQEIKVRLGIEETSVEGINAAISGLSDEARLNDLKLKITPVDDAVRAFLESDVDKNDAKVVYTVDQSAVDAWKAPKKPGIIEYRGIVVSTPNTTISSTSKYTGDIPKLSARALALNGLTGFTAYASGTIGAKKTETALTGEVGPEMVVYGNRWWTVGDDHVEMAQIPKGAIVFNAAQTKEILEKGFTTKNGGRGIAYASGTAYYPGHASGSLHGYGDSPEESQERMSNKKSSGSSKSSSSASSAASAAEDAADAAKNLFDWIQVLLDRAAAATERLFNKAELAINSIQKKYFSDSAINSLAKELAYNQQAYNRYMQEAESVGLSEDYKEKVRNGELDIETITDEALREQIDSYQEMYENAMACADEMDSLRGEIRDTAEDIANIPLDDLDKKLDSLSDSLTLLEKRYDNVVSVADRNNLLQRQTDNAEDVWLTSKAASNEIVQSIEALKPSLINIAPDEVISGSKIDTSGLTGKNLVNAEKYNAYLDARAEILQQVSENLEDYTSALYENTKAQADNIQAAVDNQLSILESQIERYESQISLIEERGDTLGSGYYQAQIDLYNQEADALRNTTNELQNFLDTQVKQGNIQKYSDDWYELVNQIYENQNAIDEYTRSTIELQKAIDQIRLDNLERKLSVFDSLRDEADFLIDLLSNEDLVDTDTGEYTAEGITTAGLLAQQKEIAAQAAKQYKDYIAQLDADAAATGANIIGNSGYNEYIAARTEALAEYQDYILAAYEAEQSQIDLVNEKIEVEKELYADIIDARKEALETLRDEKEYAEDIEDKTQQKLLIERQLRALEGNDSDYAMKRRKELQQELDDINKDIQDTEDDHEYDMKIDALDKDLEDFQTYLDNYLKNSQQVITDLTNSINGNATVITDTLTQLSEATGYTISGTITDAWTTAGNSVAGYYGQITSVINSQSSMTTALEAIAASYDAMAASAEKASQAIAEAVENQNKLVTSAQLDSNSNSVTSNREFVEGLYRKYFGREADAEGLNTWLAVLANGGTREEVEQGFINSREYQNPKYVRELYQDLLGRTPSNDELNFWVSRLNNGMSREEVRQGFLGSAEYIRKHGTTQTQSAAAAPSTPSTPTVSENEKVSNLSYTLYRGLKNDDVRKLQKALNTIMGAGLDVDGSFGAATERAVEEFQRQNGLDPDGRVGPATRAKFRDAGFRRGGIVDILSSTGEDGLALVRNGEMILTPEDGRLLKDFVVGMPYIAQSLEALDRIRSNALSGLGSVKSADSSSAISAEFNAPLVEVTGDIDGQMAGKIGKIVKREVTNSLIAIRDNTKIKR